MKSKHMMWAVRGLLLVALNVGGTSAAWGQVKAWEGTLTIPTYAWEEDLNPRFWALDGNSKTGAAPLSAIVYPYTMQDHLSRTKVDRTYKALFLENEYLKITCLPELGGRLHSVRDKTTGQEMFHLNHVIKPSMIAMRGAWISGGVEWNAGPQGHTMTCVSPVDALVGQNPDGSAFLEVSNLEKSQRTHWTVHLTLHPGRSYVDEEIRLFNPGDALSPYYFWNCTAFPCRVTTRFMFPMTLGTDHSGKTFFTWPLHEGRDLTWLKNYETWASVFARDCVFDFFGAYEVDTDRGIVQVADHRQLSGKKAWTWGTWEFGLVSQRNLTDDDGPYIEVQSGPLPTQSDYGALWPRDEVAWQEWWYPVHGLGDGFEFATKDVAVQTLRQNGALEIRALATARFPGATCAMACGQIVSRQPVDLAPDRVAMVSLPDAGEQPIEITLTSKTGDVLAEFTSPLAIPKVLPPAREAEKSDEQLTAEELYLRGRKQDLATNRSRAREYYEKALAQDPGCVPALRGLAVLAVEAGDYEAAILQLERALARDPTDGLSWYFLGVSHLDCPLSHKDRAQDQNTALNEALHCAAQAARCFGTVSLGHDLAGRAYLRKHDSEKAMAAFAQAVQANPRDSLARDHLLLAKYSCGDARVWDEARADVVKRPTDLLPRAILALRGDDELQRFVRDVRGCVGELEFEVLDTSYCLADLGLYADAARVLDAVCVSAVPEAERSPLVLYQLAYWAALLGDEARARTYLAAAAAAHRLREFPAHTDTLAVLEYAAQEQPGDAQAHLYLGNLYAHLGRLEAAAARWRKSTELNPALHMALRNLALYTRVIAEDWPKAAALYRQAISARPGDQTLYRDLADVLIQDQQRPEAIRVLESLPAGQRRRADVLILLAQAYLDEQRFDDVLKLLEATPYFVAWEGQATTWKIFNQTHVGRGRTRLEQGEVAAALADFDAAMTYPENLGVGRSNKPEHAAALYWRGQALEALGRRDESREAWRQGAAGSEGSAQQNEYRQKCADALQPEV
jgi:tetratricopeptide (TPR) repeat protein